MRKSLFLKLLLLLILPAMIVAQSATTGAITGVVVNNDGTPLPGVAITAVHVPTGTTFMVVSRTGGLYLIPAVKAGGPYTVTAAITGFRTEKKTSLTVKLGQKTQVNFALQLATVDAGEVIVTGVDEIISKSRTGATQNVAQNVIEDLPTISRTLSDFT
ncbi:MAG: carboxypeptidase regulatory-like domain-containing protein, partial [Candidatus Aminicenantes bacterium]|nr:carboxypeptidase regulatory-like domain-containing protein [Candidatus Aminicenantes bacterium]